jgi:signal transduction histidine kinase
VDLHHERPGPARDKLSALYEMAIELSTQRELQGVLDTALSHCLSLTESEFGFIGLNTGEGQTLNIVAIRGFHPAPHFFDHYHVIPLRANLFARAVIENRPVRSEDAMTDPARVGQPSGHPPTHTFLGVPLRTHGAPIGMIGVANRATAYQSEHEDLLTTYAGQVAIAIENARLNEALAASKAELEQRVLERTAELDAARAALFDKTALLKDLLAETVSVQEAERQRLAHDLHDGPTQLLVGAMLELSAAGQRVEREDLDQARLAMSRAADILHQLERELRQTISDLRPPMLDALGLVPSLRQQVESLEPQTGVPGTFSISGEPYRLRPDVEICVYRVLQAALTNTARHAHASSCAVALEFEPHCLTLSVQDNGVGFVHDPELFARERRFGLLGMRERAEMIGGALAIQSTRQRGTHVRFSIPVSG